MARGSNSDRTGDGSPDKENSDDGSRSSPEDTNNTSKSEQAPRTKRKKARRACLACQRAHLTCSDERPCTRCIKRGLEADCHDGMRKKAKYLHDAPNEALMPGAGQDYTAANNDKHDFPVDQRNSIVNAESAVMQDGSFSQDQSVPFNSYSQANNAPQLQLHNTAPFTMYGAQSSPISPQYNSQQTSPMQGLAAPMQTQPPLDGQSYATQFLEPPDPSVFNFDLAGMNFGNHYGALEFGMLGHMSSGASGNLMQRNSMPSFESPTLSSSTPRYTENSPEAGNYIFNRNNSVPDWQQAHSARQNHPADHWASRGRSHEYNNHVYLDEPSAYSIGAVAPASAAGTSPGSNGPELARHDRQYMGAETLPVHQRSQTRRKQSLVRERSSSVPPQRGQDGPNASISKKLEKLAPTESRRRPRDPSKIYSAVTSPYPYTLGFHALTAVLLRHFSSTRRLRIAQALASIRPSFISCTRTLMDDDLIFMEKCFQRQLWEYEDFVSACGTPTIVCRRTGEVAYAGKEFTTLTGWRKSVLLGVEPNLNVNGRGDNGTHSGAMTSSSRGGVNTPRLTTDVINLDADRIQPVFIAELLDHDNVVQFYEDFAKLAFADSKGSACKPCKLLKYKTKDDPTFHNRLLEGQNGDDDKVAANGDSTRPMRSPGSKKKKAYNSSGMRVDKKLKGINATISNEAGINKLGDKEGKVDCMYCWTVKRDVFDIPMMIVINFLPMLT